MGIVGSIVLLKVFPGSVGVMLLIAIACIVIAITVPVALFGGKKTPPTSNLVTAPITKPKKKGFPWLGVVKAWMGLFIAAVVIHMTFVGPISLKEEQAPPQTERVVLTPAWTEWIDIPSSHERDVSLSDESQSPLVWAQAILTDRDHRLVEFRFDRLIEQNGLYYIALDNENIQVSRVKRIRFRILQQGDAGQQDVAILVGPP